VFLVLVAWVLVVFDLGIEIELVTDRRNGLGEFDDRNRTRNLIVNIDLLTVVAALDESDDSRRCLRGSPSVSAVRPFRRR